MAETVSKSKGDDCSAVYDMPYRPPALCPACAFRRIPSRRAAALFYAHFRRETRRRHEELIRRRFEQQLAAIEI
jgi:hypothetical protein